MSHLQGKQRKYLSTIHIIFQNNNSEGKKNSLATGYFGKQRKNFFFSKNFCRILFNLTQTYVFPTEIMFNEQFSLRIIFLSSDFNILIEFSSILLELKCAGNTFIVMKYNIFHVCLFYLYCRTFNTFYQYVYCSRRNIFRKFKINFSHDRCRYHYLKWV